MLPRLLRLALILPLALASLVVAPTRADALTTRCAIIQSRTVGGFTWSRMPVKRLCRNNLSYGVAGSAQLSARTVTIQYSERNTSVREVQKATVHELAHEVEFWTTPSRRARLYGYLGIKNHPSYFGFNDNYYYSGSMAAWRQSPRERLAESVVRCRYGSPNHSGLVLVPTSRCTAFLRDFRAALADAH